jgi:hypothetical protein
MNLPRISFALLMALIVCAAGCGNGRQGVEGVVTVDGQVLSRGYISFRPVPPTHGPTAGTEVIDGRFSVASAKGPLAGTFCVEITASRPSGPKLVDDFSGKLVDSYEQFLPTRYNSLSELTAEITDEGPNRFDFALDSKP